MRTSPLHPHPCRGASEAMTSTASTTSVSSERPIIPLGCSTRPSPIPMLPTSIHAHSSHTHVGSSGGAATTVTAASQEAIQLATVVENSPKSLSSSDQTNFEFYNICSPKALCGPHPRKVTIVVALILSIWASFVLGINIHKRVITMEDKLASMTQKMLDLQVKYLDLEVQSSGEITRLHQKVNDLTETTVQKERTYPGSNSRRQRVDKIQIDKRERGSPKVTTTKTTTTTTTTTTKGECVTKSGVKCILPFSYLGENHDGCVRRWQDTNYWCSTRVDENGAFINSKDAWDYCDTTVCPTTTQGGDTFTWG